MFVCEKLYKFVIRNISIYINSFFLANPKLSFAGRLSSGIDVSDHWGGKSALHIPSCFMRYWTACYNTSVALISPKQWVVVTVTCKYNCALGT